MFSECDGFPVSAKIRKLSLGGRACAAVVWDDGGSVDGKAASYIV